MNIEERLDHRLKSKEREIKELRTRLAFISSNEDKLAH